MTVVPISKQQPERGVPQALGYYVCIEIWVRPDKVGNLYMPEVAKREDKYSRPVGRVVSLGPDAYTGNQYPNGAWCKVDDWVLFDRGEAAAHNYFGIAYAFIPDNKIVANIPDPNLVTKINSGDIA